MLHGAASNNQTNTGVRTARIKRFFEVLHKEEHPVVSVCSTPLELLIRGLVSGFWQQSYTNRPGWFFLYLVKPQLDRQKLKMCQFVSTPPQKKHQDLDLYAQYLWGSFLATKCGDPFLATKNKRANHMMSNEERNFGLIQFCCAQANSTLPENLHQVFSSETIPLAFAQGLDTPSAMRMAQENVKCDKRRCANLQHLVHLVNRLLDPIAIMNHALDPRKYLTLKVRKHNCVQVLIFSFKVSTVQRLSR